MEAVNTPLMNLQDKICPNAINIHCVTLNCGGQVPSCMDELFPLFEVKMDEMKDK